MKVLIIPKQTGHGLAPARVIGPFDGQEAVDDWLERRFGHEPPVLLVGVYDLEEPDWEPVLR